MPRTPNRFTGRTAIIAFGGAFHGRTLATIAAGGQQNSLEVFGAKVDGWVLRPADGWREEPTPGHHADLGVLFTPAEGQALEVYVACRDGNPVFVPGGRLPRR